MSKILYQEERIKKEEMILTTWLMIKDEILLGNKNDSRKFVYGNMTDSS